MEKHFLITTIAGIVFYIVYYFFFRKESFHKFNRFYLLGALLVSLLIPFIRFTIPSSIVAVEQISPLSELLMYVQLPELTVSAQTASGLSLSTIFWGIYWIGVAFFAFLFIAKLFKIASLIIQSKKNREGSYVFVEYNELNAPFSFFHYIFINSEAYNEEDKQKIILHEKIHVKQRHSWDLVLSEVIGIILWFNPVIFLYKRSLQIIHEYLADHRVLQQGIEQGAYLELLLRQLMFPNMSGVVQNLVPVIGHHFNYLLTKNRFKMLKNHHYSKWALAKVIFVLPLIAFLLMLNCKNKPEEPRTTEYQFTIENTGNPNEEVTYNIDISEGEDGTKQINIKKEDEAPLRYVEDMPEPVGGFDAMYAFLQENLRYPANARDKGIGGQVFVEFVIEKDGSVTNVKILTGVDPELDAESVRVVSMMPKWKPGKQNGKPVRTFYQIPIRFTISKD